MAQATAKKGSRNGKAERKKNPEILAIYKRVGESIARLRAEAGISQREACEQVLGNRSLQSVWSRWERGETLPNIATLERIAAWGGVTLDDLGFPGPKETITRADLIAIKRKLDEISAIVAKALDED